MGASTPHERLKKTAQHLIEQVLPRPRPLGVRFWDGSLLPPEVPREDTVILVLKRPEVLARLLEPPLDLALGEAYLEGDFDVEGNLEKALEIAESLTPRLNPLEWAGVLRDATSLKKGLKALGVAARLKGRAHSKERDRQAIQHHYDVSNRFYRLWLDQRMVYSCAYFPQGDEDLDQAQENKLELVLKKLRLQPGERLLDVGAGWGGLIVYAAERYGAQALGVTLSKRQVEHARAVIAENGLEDRVQIELRDYRDVRGPFDKAASIGMAEHVGREKLPEYFRTLYQALRPGGLLLHHVITRGPVPPRFSKTVASGEFMRRYVFPDGEILPLWTHLKAAEEAGFEVCDVEDLRPHYAKTLRHWVARLEARFAEAVREVGAARARLWRLYMSASAYQFAAGHLAIHQVLLAKPNAKGQAAVPPSRADLYIGGGYGGR
ncbi:SAM-dependent methyltransferase [Marinithermus hydrothermalis]|uniref:Cyclopropane-fatty-acyl-phospholipid synthase n=1 Tax=Marinithermus hydrothermalis (strain DSM 14884 / JCM 11576 / T1) TaxID=869210 RepID=F2NNL9_MARHT|nr:cyclopropane-fatty-acyl-phospholipid synthase family protein [Marinithermus hydrothermalis]AEB11034.1 Cyclopropane-fatty-acyl-phospholipid synthase [Marinithermus hydrothermalis DSM 14884]